MAKAKSNESTQSTESKVARGILTALQAPYSGTLGAWMAHGATELANFAVHGKAAPMYSHGGSPNEQPAWSPPDATPAAPESPMASPEQNAPQPALDIVDKYLPTQTKSTVPQQTQAIVTSHGAETSQSPGVAEKYLQAIKTSQSREQPKPELSK